MSTREKLKSKPSVSVIGAGRLGTALAIALTRSGYNVVSLVGRRQHQVRKAAQMLDVPCETLVAKEFGKYKPTQLVIVAVPDDRIPQVAESLIRIPVSKHPRHTVVHTSGALSSSVFAKLAGRGWQTGSVHPLISISEPRSGAVAFRESYWCIEGDRGALRLARNLVKDVGGKAFSIATQDKPLYHAAAVMSSGHVVALFDVAVKMLEDCGLSRPKAQEVLLPLLQSTINNLFQFDPKEAMTGPFARGDFETVKRHISTLIEKNLTDVFEIYRILGKHSLKLVGRKAPGKVVKEIQNNLPHPGPHGKVKRS